MMNVMFLTLSCLFSFMEFHFLPSLLSFSTFDVTFDYDSCTHLQAVLIPFAFLLSFPSFYSLLLNWVRNEKKEQDEE
jgi:hypothetical protein